jgi:adenylate cyclase
VNLASRLASLAEPGQILADPELADDLAGAFDSRSTEPRQVKGIGEVRPVELRGG